MSDTEFQSLINGPLSHPIVPFQISRLTLALMAVVAATGEAGEKALREHCIARAKVDLAKGGYPDHWPLCPVCMSPALHGQMTCGKASCCNELGQRLHAALETLTKQDAADPAGSLS